MGDLVVRLKPTPLLFYDGYYSVFCCYGRVVKCFPFEMTIALKSIDPDVI